MPHVMASTYVRPNKLQGNCVTCRNFHSALSNAIKSGWTCCNINLTFYGTGQGLGDEESQGGSNIHMHIEEF
ncbi:hypothetical protein KR009_004936 [Drosophila setifemur]|nr:hypothetical protein KR009_004936 [Drosophila setifemur]